MISRISPLFARLRTLMLVFLAISFVGISVGTDFIFRHEIKRKARKELEAAGLQANVNGIIDAVRKDNLVPFEKFDTAGISFGAVGEKGMTPLHVAIASENKAAIEQVMQRSEDVKCTIDEPCHEGQTPLKRAFEARDFALADQLVDNLSANINAEKSVGLPYLLDAISEDDTEMLDYLLSKGVDVNEQGSQPLSALALAADDDDLELMQRLVAQGANVNQAGATGKPLHLEAAYDSEYEEVAFLLNEGASVDATHEEVNLLTLALQREDKLLRKMAYENKANLDRSGLSGEHLAVDALRAGDKPWLESLLDSGIPVATLTEAKDTLLLDAAKRLDYPMVDLLIERGADVNAKDAAGLTPLQLAVNDSDTALVRTLVTNRAEIHEAEMFATAYRNRDNPTMSLLLNAGVDPEINLSGTDRRIMDVAVAEGSNETVRTLLSAGAEIGDNLWGALLTGQDDLVAMVLQNGVDPNQRGPKGEEPLEYALNNERYHLLKPFLAAGADPNPMYDEDESWVSRAIRTGNKDAALALVEAGADLGDGVAADGHSLLTWTIARNLDNVTLALIKAGVDVNHIEPHPAKAELIEGFPQSSAFRRAMRYDQKLRPLMMAATKRKHEVAQALVSAGAKLHATRKGLYPVSIAAWYNDVPMMQILYRKNPDYQERKVVVNLSSQRMTLYEHGKPVFGSVISSGKPGYRTQTGTFAITQKRRYHTSTIYGSSMPYFMRVSWKDFGLHVGNCPGYPASAGCVRLPWHAAQYLYSKCTLGDMVVIRY